MGVGVSLQPGHTCPAGALGGAAHLGWSLVRLLALPRGQGAGRMDQRESLPGLTAPSHPLGTLPPAAGSVAQGPPGRRVVGRQSGGVTSQPRVGAGLTGPRPRPTVCSAAFCNSAGFSFT